MDNHATLEAAASYWANELQIEAKRAEFRAALLVVLEREWAEMVALTERSKGTPWFSLSVDYDPDHLLLEALHAVGIECRGCMFSADGLFYRKTRSEVRAGYFGVREGYGADWRDVHGSRPDKL